MLAWKNRPIRTFVVIVQKPQMIAPSPISAGPITTACRLTIVTGVNPARRKRSHTAMRACGSDSATLKKVAARGAARKASVVITRTFWHVRQLTGRPCVSVFISMHGGDHVLPRGRSPVGLVAKARAVKPAVANEILVR